MVIFTVVSSVLAVAAAASDIGGSLAERLGKIRAAREARKGAATAAPQMLVQPAPVIIATQIEPADPDGVLADLEARKPADAVDWRPIAALPEVSTTSALPGGSQKAPELCVSPAGDVFLLDAGERHIFRIDTHTGALNPIAQDRSPGLIEMADAAILRDGSLVIADNSRQAVFLFRNYRHIATLGLMGERMLFRFIRHVFPLPDGGFAVTDSGANRTFTFDSAGELRCEIPGTVEPLLYDGKFIRLVISEKAVRGVALDPATGRETPVFGYEPPAGRLALDAQAVGAGVTGKDLTVIVSEGEGNADHTAWSRVIRLKNGSMRTASVLPDLTFDLSGRRTCVMTNLGGSPKCISLRQTLTGTGLFIADLE